MLIGNNIPFAGTSIAVLKSLLAQMLEIRVGNVQAYRTIAQAYEQCSTCVGLSDYENHLWKALEDVFKTPLPKARDLVVVVDGLDEIQGGQVAGQAFFERLAGIACEGERVKFVGLSQNLSMPSGVNTTQITVTNDKVHDDIHAVLLKTLMHTNNLTSRPGPEARANYRQAFTGSQRGMQSPRYIIFL